VEKIYCCGITPAPVDRFKKVREDFSKVSLGAHEYVSWESGKSAEEVVRELKKEGYAIYAVEQSGNSSPYYKMAPAGNDRILVIMGNEVAGLPAPILKLADAVIEIPMFGKKESLNVAVAFGIVVFGFVLGLKK
jgi:tRNA G18 (ribose-2'-O)-methylase SpoU